MNFIINFNNHYQIRMHPHLNRKMKRFLTEPDQYRQNNETKYKKLALKEFKLQIGKRQNSNEITTPNFDEKYAIVTKNQVALPHSIKRNKQRHALVRLPELYSQNYQNIQEQGQKNPIFKRSNPLYVVNSLFQIMKEDISKKHATLTHSKSNQYSRKDPSKIIQTKDISKNQFNEFEVKSMKMQRPPRLLDNQINRLTQHSIFSRRRIYSQEKSRGKCEKDVQLITFYNCRQKSQSKNNGDSCQFDYLKFTQK